MEYTWKEFDFDCFELSKEIKRICDTSTLPYDSIYGVPRGGVPLAVKLSSLTGLKLVSLPEARTLIVDDIIDSGRTRYKYPLNDFVVLHGKSEDVFGQTFCLHKTTEWVKYPWETDEEQNGEDIVVRMLEYIGENPNRIGLKDTPARVAKMWREIFKGYDPEQFPKVTIFPNGQDGVLYQDMIIDNGYFYSHCEHHLATFFGEFWFGYVPDEFIVGASKISRVVDFYSARLQVAERLVHDVVSFFESHLKPKGLILVMKGRHLCKEMRGIKKYNSPFEVIAVRGCFEKNDKNCKNEFLSRIK